MFLYDIVEMIGDQKPADICRVRCGGSELDVGHPQERSASRGKRIRYGAGFAVEGAGMSTVKDVGTYCAQSCVADKIDVRPPKYL